MDGATVAEEFGLKLASVDGYARAVTQGI
jgi:hypothetical protein